MRSSARPRHGGGPDTERAIRLYDANDAAALAQFLDSLFREPSMLALVERLLSSMHDHVGEFGAVPRSGRCDTRR